MLRPPLATSHTFGKNKIFGNPPCTGRIYNITNMREDQHTRDVSCDSILWHIWLPFHICLQVIYPLLNLKLANKPEPPRFTLQVGPTKILSRCLLFWHFNLPVFYIFSAVLALTVPLVLVLPYQFTYFLRECFPRRGNTPRPLLSTPPTIQTWRAFAS